MARAGASKHCVISVAAPGGTATPTSFDDADNTSAAKPGAAGAVAAQALFPARDKLIGVRNAFPILWLRLWFLDPRLSNVYLQACVDAYLIQPHLRPVDESNTCISSLSPQDGSR